MTDNDDQHCRNMTDLQGLEDHVTVQGKLTHSVLSITQGKSWLLMMRSNISVISDQITVRSQETEDDIKLMVMITQI